MVLEEDIISNIIALKDLGIGAISMVVFYAFAREIVRNYSRQLEDTNKRFTDFMEKSYKENTKTIAELVNSFKEHINIKERALEMLETSMQLQEQRFKDLDEKYEYLRKYHE